MINARVTPVLPKDGLQIGGRFFGRNKVDIDKSWKPITMRFLQHDIRRPPIDAPSGGAVESVLKFAKVGR